MGLVANWYTIKQTVFVYYSPQDIEQFKAEIEKRQLKDLPITQDMEQFKAELEKRDLKDTPTMEDMEQLKAELKSLSTPQDVAQFKIQFEKDLKNLPIPQLAETGKGDKDQEGKEPKQQVKS